MPATFTAPKQNLRQLIQLRWALIIGLGIGLLISHFWFSLPLRYSVLGVLVAMLVVLNVLTHLRLSRTWPVSNQEFFTQILLDIAGVSCLFYFSGGATNPFVSYYLVPITVAIVTLPWSYTWIVALLSVCSYSLLLFFYIPIAELDPAAGLHAGHAMHSGSGSMLNAHVLGMWFNFVLSAGLIAYFVVRMVNSLRVQQQQLNEYREENLRDEQVLAVATLAAGTAHELGSPLTTMKVLLSEIRYELDSNNNREQGNQLREDIGLLEKQVELCSHTLKDLVRRAESNQSLSESAVSIGQYCEKIIERWQVLRPNTKAQITIQKADRARLVNFHTTVDQSIINLLNNAAEAAKTLVTVNISWDTENITLVIDDDGPGIPEDIKSQIGQAFVSTKGKGLGLGLFLSNATIARYQGTLSMHDREGGGTRTIIRLPINYQVKESVVAQVSE